MARRTDRELGRRRYLTEQEAEALLNAAKDDPRHGHRNWTMLSMLYRHGLRITEAIELRWWDVDLGCNQLHIRRLKGSESGVHPLSEEEIGALKALRAQYPEGEYVFQSQMRGRMNRSTANRMLHKLAERIGMPYKPTLHSFRHGCGFVLVNRGVDIRKLQGWLGHRDIKNTSMYAALSSSAYNGIWE